MKDEGRGRKLLSVARRRWGRTLLLVLVLLGVGGYLELRQVKRHRLPVAAWQCLDHPQKVTVFSLHSRPAIIELAQQGSKNPQVALASIKLFHGYRILGQTDVSVEADMRRVSAAVDGAASSVFQLAYMCFDPRHGVRISDGHATSDFVICFECHGMDCFVDDRKVAYTEIGGSPEALNALLQAAHVPIEKASEQN